MRINFIDNIPLDDGVMGYGISSTGASVYFVIATGEGATITELNVEAINALYNPPENIKERRLQWLTDKP